MKKPPKTLQEKEINADIQCFLFLAQSFLIIWITHVICKCLQFLEGLNFVVS